MKENVEVVLLASGGLDSTTLAYWLMDRQMAFVPLFIDYGQHCAKTEYATLQKVLPPGLAEEVKLLGIADIYRGAQSRLIREPDLWKDDMSGDPLYLPYRNLLLLSVGAAFAQSQGFQRVFAGFINSNHAKELDCSSKFFESLQTLLADYGSVRVEMPFRDMSKYEVAKVGVSLGVPIAETYSCQASSEVPCGACPNCVDRLNALSQLS